MHFAPVAQLWTEFAPILVAAAISFLVLASLNDIARRIIPDTICLALAGIGILLRLGDGHIFGAVLAAIIVFILSMACCLKGWMGGGDVKLLSASVLLVPPSQVFTCIFCIGIAGGMLALLYIVLRRLVPRPGPRPASLIARACRVEAFRIRRGGPLPYGVGIAAGAILVLLRSHP
jgi:prepilin peptidase CpaA